MSADAYERLAAALDRLPNGFPRTPAGTEIRILQKILSPEEAALAGRLGGEMEPLEQIAARLGLPAAETRDRLMDLVRKGAVWFDKEGGRPRFRLAPFVVGFYEAQLHNLDHELAHLVEHYMLDGGAQGIMGPEPALHRVMPTQGTVKSEWILPYDDVRALLLEAKSFAVRDCICRVQQDLLGKPCRFPTRICLNFSSMARLPRPGDLTQEEALALLDQSEEAGLVHTVSNVMQGVGYICNCCSCCCGILRGITDYGLPNSVAAANYYAVIEAGACQGCETCVERCQVHAIAMQDGVAVVERARCIGCGLCVSGCPDAVPRLVRRPEAEIVHPPADFAAWEQARLWNRGLASIAREGSGRPIWPEEDR
jgi:electron transport complex protein RnfB